MQARLPRLQDISASWSALHHRPLHKLRPKHRSPDDPKGPERPGTSTAGNPGRIPKVHPLDASRNSTPTEPSKPLNAHPTPECYVYKL